MQQPSLQLKEIIWEITGECHNGCTYCGSKEVWKNTTDEMTILSIADRIAKYPPKEINISGGDPLCVSFSTHQYIINLLRSQDVTCKILVNPKSLIKNSKEENFFIELAKGKEVNGEAIDKIFLYDWIGISVNTEEEFELLEALQTILSNQYTVISNFNTANLYMFDTIKEFVEKNNLQWQVQLTMTDSKVMAIYKNPKALKTLLSKIQDAYNNNIRVIPADNINNGKCGAGSQSLGILSNGDVIPCLSMRSWNKQLPSLVQENILATSLEEIWETKFKEYRYCCFNCCKDDCGNIDFCLKESDLVSKNINTFLKPKKDIGQSIPEFSKHKPSNPPMTVLYGVRIDNEFDYFKNNTGVMAYAVFNSPNYQPVITTTSSYEVEDNEVKD